MVIIARGDEIRHFMVRPWMLALVGSVCAAIAVGYLLATTYLVLRDDLIGATIARQARMQQAYEDRISALRAQVDRITSRQLLDQQLMETKVSELLERQSQLYLRHGRLRPILERAEGDMAAPAPQPSASEPDHRADAATPAPVKAAAATSVPAMAFWHTRNTASNAMTAADKADHLFLTINQSLQKIESEQIDRIASLAEDADRQTDTIAQALEDVGMRIELEGEESTTGIGGPYIPADDTTMFETRVRELDEALGRLESAKLAANTMPIHSPARGFSISSPFGVRRDPLIGRPAMHAGMDFRAPSGSTVRAAGAGTVIRAGWNGGYGRMVEIDHGDGLTTRYAHMSQISVKVGDQLARGDLVGKVGTSGRSTGPHLHYEVRRNNTAIDPMRFIKVGRKIANII